MKTRRPGAALLSALLVAGWIAGLASHALWLRWRSIESEQALRHRADAQWIMEGAIDWALARLREDALRRPGVDHLAEDWAQATQGLPIQAWLRPAGLEPSDAADPEGSWAQLDLVMSDAQSRLNLLNLIEGRSLSPLWLEVFARLFQQLGLPRQELLALGQALLRASAGTDLLQAGPAPLMPQRPEDLVWLGLSPSSTALLRPYLSVLPGRLPVNLNTAAVPVLQAVLDLPAESVQALIARRQDKPFTELSDAGLNDRADATRHSVGSQFFELQVRLVDQEGTRQTRALLQRQNQDLRILWRI